MRAAIAQFHLVDLLGLLEACWGACWRPRGGLLGTFHYGGKGSWGHVEFPFSGLSWGRLGHFLGRCWGAVGELKRRKCQNPSKP